VKLLLGLDTSCDDTGVGVVRGRTVLANIVASQEALHAAWGGVVPETASREHLRVIDAVVNKALKTAGVTLDDLDGVAATYGPGLVGALLVGLSYAKGLAFALNKPFYAVHHLEGHIASSLMDERVAPPFLCLIASGGHTSLFDVRAWGTYREVGCTRDDAAGEAFDKVARLLGLGFPGGPALSKAAESGDSAMVNLPLPMRGQAGFDFSFSGLKTAVATLLQKQPDAHLPDVAAAFEQTVIDSLVQTTERAARSLGYQTIVIAGGVAANQRLRNYFERSDLHVHFPPLQLATDNGAMIALAAQQRREPSPLTIDATPYLPLDTNLRSSAVS
jgi:N6-L-threonylcarbamoyladenine synthase